VNERKTASMRAGPDNRRIASRADLERELDALVARDPELGELRARCGEIPTRLTAPGFAALCWIVCGQLLSVAAARAIHGRLVAQFGTVTGAAILAANDETLSGLGLSRAKIRALKSIAAAERNGVVDLVGLHRFGPEAARAELLALPGVGPWTADIYCLTAAGHSDIFPAGDLALRKMVGTMGRFAELPSIAATGAHAARWAPHRSAAARLLWQGFAARTHKEGLAL